MNFQKKCLHCGRPSDSVNYTCTCQDADWLREYRVLDLSLSLTPADKEKARASFLAYRFDHPAGLLQYHLLPFRENAPPGLPAVGLTPLHHLQVVSLEMGCRVFIKDEGDNPSGCFKDRETLLCLLNSRRRGLTRAVIYSSGNAAASAALFAQQLQLHLITFVAGDTYPEKIDFIRNRGADVIVIGDEHTSFEEGFRLFAQLNADGVFARNGYDNWTVRNPYRVQGDKTTALEIVKQLSSGGVYRAPDYVIVPTGNGSCLAGIWKGFKELKKLDLIDTLPRMVSAGIEHASPVYRAVQREKTDAPVACDLDRLDPTDAGIGSIIVAEEGYDSPEAAKAVLESGGLATVVNTDDIRRAMITFLEKEKELALRHGILPEPVSYISLAAIEKIRQRLPLHPDDKVVAVITGHGLKARETTDDLLAGRPDLKEMVDRISRMKKGQMPDRAAIPGRRIDVAADYDTLKYAFSQSKPEPV